MSYMPRPPLHIQVVLPMVPFALAKDPPLFLIPLLSFEDYTMVFITYTHICKYDAPFCPDSSDKERLLCVIDEYLEN